MGLDLLSLQNQFYKQLETKGRSLNTLKNYKTDLDCFNEFLDNNNSLEKFENFALEGVIDYSHYLENRYKSSNSIRRRVQTLRMFFDFLMERDVFKENPVRKVPTSPKQLSKPNPTTLLEVKTFWELLLSQEKAAENDFHRLIILRNQMIFLLIYTGGLKISDLNGLKASCLILSKDQKEARVLVTPEKREPYTVPLHPITCTIYLKYQELLDEFKEKGNLHFDDLLFNANAHRILRGNLGPRGIEILFEELRKKIEINLTPKSLRQSSIFLWLSERHPESLIKEWLGVAPSYSLKTYREYLSDNMHNSHFLLASYKSAFKRKYR